MREQVKFREVSGGELVIDVNAVSAVIGKDGFPTLLYDKAGNKFGLQENYADVMAKLAPHEVEGKKKNESK